MRAFLALSLAFALGACGSAADRAAEHLRKAQAFYDEGNYVAAKIEARNAVQLLPKEAKAHYLLALIAERQQDPRPLVQHLAMTVAADPSMVQARVKLGTLYFLGQAYKEAAEQAKAAMALAPDDAEVRLLNARVLFQNKDQAAAIRELDVALALNPDLVDAIAVRATAEAVSDPQSGLQRLDQAIARLVPEQARPLRQVRIAILTQLGRQTEVEQAYRDMLRDFPGDRPLQYQLARFYATTGRLDDAEATLWDIVSQHPDDIGARLELVKFLVQLRGREVAEQALDSFLAKDPDQPEIRAALGRLYSGQGRVDAALEVYEEVVRRHPKSGTAKAVRVSAAALRIGRGETDAARKLVDGVLEEDPAFASALLMRAGLRVRDRQFTEAVADARAVLRQQPRNPAALLVLANAHVLMGERSLAKDAYRTLLEVDPRNGVAPGSLAVLEALDENYAAAERILRERLALVPEDIDTRVRLISLLASQQVWTKAEAQARRLAALPNDQGIGELQLSKVFWAQDRKEEAVAVMRQGLEANPASIIALDGLVMLLAETGRSAEAAGIVEAFRKEHPEDLGAKFLEGQLLAYDGGITAAQRIFEEIVSTQPRATKAWESLVRLPADPAVRIQVCQRALAANPGHVQLSLLLASSFEEAGRFDDAIAVYQKVLSADAGVEQAINNLAALLLDYRTDRESHARALELVRPLESSKDPRVMDTIGWAYYRNRKYSEAVEFLESAVKEAGPDAQMRYHLGMTYLAVDNVNEAREELRLALSITKQNFPGRAEARATLAKLGD